MDKKVYTWAQIKDLIKDQDYKHIKLSTLDGEKLVSYNAINLKQKGLEAKLKEIEKRMKLLEDGIYVVTCQTKYGNTSPQVSHYLGIGAYDKSVIDKTPPANLRENFQQQQPTKTEKLLSVDSALDNVRTIADLQAKVARLEDKITRLEEENAELEAELDEMESGGMSEGDNNPFKGVLEGLLPVADRYFDMEERKQKFKEGKFLHDAGYEIPGLKRGARNGTPSRREVSKRKEIPEPGAPGWQEYIDSLDALADKEFNLHLSQLRENAPEIYDAVCEEFQLEEVETEEEEEQEEQ